MSDTDPPRRRGRPREGTRTHLVIPDEMLDAADERARERGTVRAEVLRRWLALGRRHDT